MKCPPPAVLGAPSTCTPPWSDWTWCCVVVVPVMRFREIQALATEPELPCSYRQAYGRIVSLLSSIEGTIRSGKGASREFWKEAPNSPVESGDTPPDADLVRTVQETIKCWRRRQIDPSADTGLTYVKVCQCRSRQRFARHETGSAKSRYMDQFRIGANTS